SRRRHTRFSRDWSSDVCSSDLYRDRTVDEIRDIHVARLEDGAWRTLPAVHADNWKIAGCPVNGPAIAATGNDAVVAWFSAANDRSEERRVGQHWSSGVTASHGV